MVSQQILVSDQSIICFSLIVLETDHKVLSIYDENNSIDADNVPFLLAGLVNHLTTNPRYSSTK